MTSTDRPGSDPGAATLEAVDGHDRASSGALRVAYTVEQSWHRVPGGTAVAALRVAEELADNPRFDSQVELRFVAGKHPSPPEARFVPNGPVAMLPLGRTLLYEGWTRLNWPKVEAVTGPVDVVHATGLVPAATSSPLVVTVHDLAFVHTPEKFTRRGAAVMNRALTAIRRRADAVICSSIATVDDCVANGFDPATLRHVPLGVDANPAAPDAVDEVRDRLGLPDEFVLFVGTIEPRKNLARLAEAMQVLRERGVRSPLIVAGSGGWGDARATVDESDDVRFLGPVTSDDLGPLYAAASVMAYPSEREGFGLPVLEAMAQGTAVVTSRGTSTEEVAGGAAVLVDPFDVDDIARGVAEALERRSELADPSRARAAEMSWEHTAAATLDVYREVQR